MPHSDQEATSHLKKYLRVQSPCSKGGGGGAARGVGLAKGAPGEANNHVLLPLQAALANLVIGLPNRY